MSVLGRADLALQKLAPGDGARDDILGIERAARRAAELCRQMLAYAGKGSLKTEPLDLRETVEEMGSLLAASTSKNVHTDYRFEPGLPLLEGDASQIRQVVMNLITNAAESFGDAGGTIRVTGRVVERSRPELAEYTLGEGCEPGRFVELAVADDGCGMDAETLPRIFEPFYTDKFAGRGLGLAAALGIVRRHRGAIRVESEPERGTTATLLLPAAEGAAPGTESTPEPVAWRGGGTVLLVDDAEDAREVGSLMLERGGFRVLAAEDGPSALELFRRHRADIVCVLLDLTLPGMDGVEICHRLRKLSADVPVVLCSGYPEDSVVERHERLGVTGFLEKPYTSASLLARVRRAMERAHDDARRQVSGAGAAFGPGAAS